VIFQPHRFTRTRDLLDQFATAFVDADAVLVLDIYAASEPPVPGVTGERLAQAVQSAGKRDSARYVRSFEEAARLVADLAEPGDMVLTLGAGSVSQLGPMVLEQLEKKRPAISTQQSA
jgi:UDP-N-acetylmuramate--alanine ligase